MSMSTRIKDNLYLVERFMSPATFGPPETTHRICVVDCSGSMSHDLPMLRRQLKAKLPTMLDPGDTFSLIRFSGKGQWAIALAGVHVSNLPDLKDVYEAIDMYLQPLGLTGFLEPLKAIPTLYEYLQEREAGPVALFFMSDGHDNQWPRAEILNAAAELEVASTTFVEYGLYADRDLLGAMASQASGALIYADDFDAYAPLFERAMTETVFNAPKRQILVSGNVPGQFAFGLDMGNVITATINDGSALMPGHLNYAYYLSDVPEGEIIEALDRPVHLPVDALYTAMALYAARQQSAVVWDLLKASGDVYLIKLFSTCFSKQEFTAFQAAALGAADDVDKRYHEGFSPNMVPKDDAFTLLDLFALFTADDRVIIDADFKYNRISRQRVDASESISQNEIEEVQRLAGKLTDEESLNALRAKLAEIDIKRPLKFVADPINEFPWSGIKYNSTRPNILFSVRRHGIVDLSDLNPPDIYPLMFETQTFRDYALIKDGLVNVDFLKMKLSEETEYKLGILLASQRISTSQVVPLSDDDRIYLFNLRTIPLMNRKMIQDNSVNDLGEAEYALLKLKAAQKVYRYFRDQKFPDRVGKKFAAIYGEAGAMWLKEHGITESGFAPKGKSVPSTDYYMGKTLEVTLKGINDKTGRLVNIDIDGTKVEQVRAQIESGLYTPAGRLMAPFILNFEMVLVSPMCRDAADVDALLWAYLDGKAQDATRRTRELMAGLARAKFAILVGQSWFSDLGPDENLFAFVARDGHTVEGTVEKGEVKINI
jgi:hypothetical protein